MNVRLTVACLGAIMLAFGFVAILRPLLVLGMLGLVVVDASHTAFCLGETRATYGGIFAVMGVVTLWAALDPYRYRDRTLAVGLLWLGACAARLFGASVDGSPGPLGWVSAGFEATVGLLLTVASWLAAPKELVQAGPTQP